MVMFHSYSMLVYHRVCINACFLLNHRYPTFFDPAAWWPNKIIRNPYRWIDPILNQGFWGIFKSCTCGTCPQKVNHLAILIFIEDLQREEKGMLLAFTSGNRIFTCRLTCRWDCAFEDVQNGKFLADVTLVIQGIPSAWTFQEQHFDSKGWQRHIRWGLSG